MGGHRRERHALELSTFVRWRQWMWRDGADVATTSGHVVRLDFEHAAANAAATLNNSLLTAIVA